MSTCQDKFFTTFPDFPAMLGYHENQAKESQWERRRVKDLRLEPLDTNAPLYSDLSSFAPGISREAVEDTAHNLGLAMKMDSGYYPVRDTAYKSLLGRAKINGTALPKLKRDKLADILNACMTLFGDEALLLIRDEKVSAVHSGGESDYAVLPVDELLMTLKAKLDARFPGNNFVDGYCDHSIVSASWEMPDQKDDLLGTYAKLLAAQGKTSLAAKLVPGIRFMTSDTGTASAKVSALLMGSQFPIHIGECVAVDHRKGHKVSDFESALEQVFAQFGDLVGKLQKLLEVELDYPINAMTRVCKKLSLPKKAAVEAIAMYEMALGGNTATAHDVYFAMQEIPFILKTQGAPESKILSVEENMARALTLRWSDYDLAKGIGQKTAEKIYDLFGVKALDVLDSEPEKLLQIKGITEKKLQKIRESYLMNRGARDIIAFLAPHGITPRQALKFYEEYAEHTMDTVKNHPYRLCELSGVGFLTADKIAASMGFDQLSTERVDEGLLYTLTEAEGCGHLCMEKHAFLKAALKLLDTPDLTAQMAANRAARLVESGQLTTYDQYVYRTKTAHAENHLARRIQQFLQTKITGCTNLETELDSAEKRLNLRFAPEQRQAVKMALTQGLSVITGGPGTGKTMIQKAILDIYHRQNPDATICCCAPTGRAARRMEQATGHPASTIHKALNLMADEDGNFNEPELLDADLVLVDEVSMLDVYLAGYLLDAISLGAQVVLIGDADQLPSVGPGAVLSEIIASGKVPVARLDKVFRQQAGSRIAVNAKAIRQGVRNLEFGEDFQFVESPDIETSADKVVELYLQEVKKYGLDNVALLTPYRKKTATGANALNLRLRDLVNPPAPGKPEATHGKRVFRLDDRVMQTKNLGEVNNGDVGYITDIFRDTDGITIRVNFGDGREVEYDTDQLSMLDLGYASTVHKSQGSEYQSVIVNLQKTHYIMLTRPLVYTAITRGKSRVILVGEKQALYIAISRTDTEKRGTCLAKRIRNS